MAAARRIVVVVVGVLIMAAVAVVLSGALQTGQAVAAAVAGGGTGGDAGKAGTGGGAFGGAIYSTKAGTVTVQRSSFSRDDAVGGNGGYGGHGGNGGAAVTAGSAASAGGDGGAGGDGANGGDGGGGASDSLGKEALINVRFSRDKVGGGFTAADCSRGTGPACGGLGGDGGDGATLGNPGKDGKKGKTGKATDPNATVRISRKAPISVRLTLPKRQTTAKCNQKQLQRQLKRGGTLVFRKACTLQLTATLAISKSTTLDGNGHRVVLEGIDEKKPTLYRKYGAVAVLKVTRGTVLLEGLRIVGGEAKGADGPDGADGATGADAMAGSPPTPAKPGVGGGFGGDGKTGQGGGLYIGAGAAVTLDQTHFVQDTAVGGDGGDGGKGGDGGSGGAVPSAVGAAGGKGGNGGKAGDGLGGAIYNAGRLTVSDSTFANDYAIGGKGGNGGDAGDGGAQGPPVPQITQITYTVNGAQVTWTVNNAGCQQVWTGNPLNWSATYTIGASGHPLSLDPGSVDSSVLSLSYNIAANNTYTQDAGSFDDAPDGSFSGGGSYSYNQSGSCSPTQRSSSLQIGPADQGPKAGLTGYQMVNGTPVFTITLQFTGGGETFTPTAFPVSQACPPSGTITPANCDFLAFTTVAIQLTPSDNSASQTIAFPGVSPAVTSTSYGANTFSQSFTATISVTGTNIAAYHG